MQKLDKNTSILRAFSPGTFQVLVYDITKRCSRNLNKYTVTLYTHMKVRGLCSHINLMKYTSWNGIIVSFNVEFIVDSKYVLHFVLTYKYYFQMHSLLIHTLNDANTV